MHSRVFQISTTQIDKENYLNEDTLNQGDNSFYDYCADISDEERKEEITNLVNSILPKGMFELVSEDTIRYTGDVTATASMAWNNGKRSMLQKSGRKRTPLLSKICLSGVLHITSSRQ